MRVSSDDIAGERGALALQVLAAGKEVLQYEQISLTNFGRSGVELCVWSQWQLENITHTAAVEEILAGSATFEALRSRWPQLSATLGPRRPPCFLHTDYGTGSIRVCEPLPDRSIRWEVESLAHAT
jgi:hypothetical protein